MGLVWRKGVGQRTVCVESGVRSEPGVFEEHREASGAEVVGAGRGEVEEKFDCYWGHVGKGFESHHRVSWGVVGGITKRKNLLIFLNVQLEGMS